MGGTLLRLQALTNLKSAILKSSNSTSS